MVDRFHVIALVPDAPGADPDGDLDGVEVVRYRYAPRRLQRLVNDGGIVGNLRRSAWKWLLLPGFVLGQMRAARRLLRTRRIDVIHAHWLIPQGWLARRLGRKYGISYLVTSHGGDLFGLKGRVLTAIKRVVANDSAGMTVVSHAMADEVGRLGFAPPRLEVVPMGVDLRDRFVPGSELRDPNALLFVGRLVEKKGLCHLLAAMPAILAERPSVVLSIAGFGPEEKALQAQVRRLGIGRSVRFLGPVPQHLLPALYRTAAVFVATFIRDTSGNQEGLPVALMEAIGCGCPVVVGNVAGVSELLGNAAQQVMVDPADTQAVARAVISVLDDLPAAQQLARELHAAAAARIDWSVVAARYGGILADVVDTPKARGTAA
jgi:glycosyltransferase involved in cell wall biosynthesis